MPNRRIVDIYVSNKEPKQTETIKVQEKEPELVKEVSLPKSKKKVLLCFLGLFFLTIFTFLFFTLPKAEVVYWPQTDPLSIDTTLTIDISSQTMNLEERIIPGGFFEKEKTVSETFDATGEATREGKAKGKITVYNEYSTSPQLLVATTRFISTEGKLFRTPVAVTIPGGHYEGGELVPGEKEIEVVADETGPEFNIGATTFSIPGFAGTARYTKFYAKSFSPMAGGFLSGSSIVTEDDIENAKISVVNSAKDQAKSDLLVGLSAEALKEYLFVESAISNELLEESSSAVADQEAGNFVYQAKARSKTMVFKKSDLEEFAKQFLSGKLIDGMAIYQDSISIDYAPESINFNSGKIILSLSLSAIAYSEVNEDTLKSLVGGKSLAGSKIITENQIGVTKAEVDFWPFWVKKAPEDPEKIEVRMKID